MVAFGTVVAPDLVLTKASQLRGQNLRCRYRNTRSFAAEVVSELKRRSDAALGEDARAALRIARIARDAGRLSD